MVANAKPRRFYLAVALAMTMLVFIGFWPSYFSVLVSGTGYDRHWVFHLHAAVFMGWMGLLITQVILARRRQTAAHMAVGRWGFVWGIAVFVLGVVVSIAIIRGGYAAGSISSVTDALWFASAPITDITQFAVLLGLGWASRRKVESHRRYMILATVAILPAATARMAYLLGPWSFEMWFLAIVAVLIWRDLHTMKEVHGATVGGVLILLPRLVLNVSYKFL